MAAASNTPPGNIFFLQHKYNIKKPALTYFIPTYFISNRVLSLHSDFVTSPLY